MPPDLFAVAIPADSARAISDVYNLSLLATLPLLAAFVAGLLLRHSNAGTRVIVWRSAVVVLVAMAVGRLAPVHWMAWVLPEFLTWPIATLGRWQLVAAAGVEPGEDTRTSMMTAGHAIVGFYWAGVIAVVLPTVIARRRLRSASRRATELDSPRWRMILGNAADGQRRLFRGVRLVASPQVAVPVTWGLLNPVIMLPAAAVDWSSGRLQAVLRHELAHVRGCDAAVRLAARLVCAVFWFHPGAWWLARRFDVDIEEACDDRVLLSGVRRSDYAEWLAASAAARGPGQMAAAMSLVRHRGLRSRLEAVTNIHRRVAAPAQCAVRLGAVVTLLLVGPMATVRLAPTRSTLTSLMRDSRWESRAWAVVRLAQRADSVDVAQAAARHDPDPAVRACARYALGLSVSGTIPRPRS